MKIRNRKGDSRKADNPDQGNPGSLLSKQDLFLFNEGTHRETYNHLGAHCVEENGVKGTCFAVWAPSALEVSLIGDFNEWNNQANPMVPRGSSGIWEIFIKGLGSGSVYKYFIRSAASGYCVRKADPYAFYAEISPKTASVVWDLAYDWGDAEWMRDRREINALDKPVSIYEMHLGSWRCSPEDGHRPLTYRELAAELVEYLGRMGFTHVEFMPVMEHPFGGSWGYQLTGYFAPTSRHGTPQDFMYLVDKLHQAGIGVILDWVPSHFTTDEHGLGFFDGTHLFEHADPRQGIHPDWSSYIFNYGRREIVSFLISSAIFWLDKYHIDGLRVDAVASMLYLDYSRQEGDWVPNEFGGRENLQAIEFMKQMNLAVYESFPDVQTYAEESTAWPMVSRPVYIGGLGFGLKWDMGWMHDSLEYFSRDPVHRKFHHNNLTFRMLYAFQENFVLPLSHDEVVHGKGSLVSKMPGDDWQKFANLRILLGFMYAQPAKKLLFMGGEFGQWSEWNHEKSLDWHLVDFPMHAALQTWVADLNRLYREETALHEKDVRPDGYEWINCGDNEQSVISILRKGNTPGLYVLAVCNLTPVPRHNYRLGVPCGEYWKELLNSDAPCYGGSGQGNLGGLEAEKIPAHARPFSLTLTLPPLSVVFLRNENPEEDG
ncbi:MAG: 1,4-alpha-glucan branching protein GlgB [Acidobacteriota bacterium]